MNVLTLNIFPSASVSLVKTLPVSGVSCGVVVVSLTATGGSFTGVTVMVKVPEPVPPFVSVAV